ncbi:hypothetical protein GCM10020000_42430 [Streptomyces olivoverticillatus]
MAYGPHPSQVVDFHRPPGAPARTRVTLLHGGFWREAYDRRHLEPLARALAARGLEVALAEYRRVGGGAAAGRRPSTTSCRPWTPATALPPGMWWPGTRPGATSPCGRRPRPAPGSRASTTSSPSHPWRTWRVPGPSG